MRTLGRLVVGLGGLALVVHGVVVLRQAWLIRGLINELQELWVGGYSLVAGSLGLVAVGWALRGLGPDVRRMVVTRGR